MLRYPWTRTHWDRGVASPASRHCCHEPTSSRSHISTLKTISQTHLQLKLQLLHWFFGSFSSNFSRCRSRPTRWSFLWVCFWRHDSRIASRASGCSFWGRLKCRTSGIESLRRRSSRLISGIGWVCFGIPRWVMESLIGAASFGPWIAGPFNSRSRLDLPWESSWCLHLVPVLFDLMRSWPPQCSHWPTYSISLSTAPDLVFFPWSFRSFLVSWAWDACLWNCLLVLGLHLSAEKRWGCAASRHGVFVWRDRLWGLHRPIAVLHLRDLRPVFWNAHHLHLAPCLTHSVFLQFLHQFTFGFNSYHQRNSIRLCL